MNRQYRSQGHSSDPIDIQADLENQFIMRFPPEAASALREAVKSGAGNLRDRLSIKLEPDKTVANQSHLRRGTVRFDDWELSAKLVDLPTIIESQKTIDRKTFYKTADICQLLICKEGEPSEDEEEELPEKKKPSQNKDLNKVEKKYLYPHGVCPPLKNCRKRRFRKVLRKNYVEAPEIEKEVRHLLRIDNEAVDVKWELITEEELNAGKSTEGATSLVNISNLSHTDNDNTAIDESDLFGALSESDDEPQDNIDVDSEGEMYNERSSSNAGLPTPSTSTSTLPLVTEFSREMFQQSSSQDDVSDSSQIEMGHGSRMSAGENAVAIKLERLRGEIAQLHRQREELQHNINNCDNAALLMRFKDSLCKVESDIRIRELDIESFQMFS